jgi:hypothetical protein
MAYLLAKPKRRCYNSASFIKASYVFSSAYASFYALSWMFLSVLARMQGGHSGEPHGQSPPADVC